MTRVSYAALAARLKAEKPGACQDAVAGRRTLHGVSAVALCVGASLRKHSGTGARACSKLVVDFLQKNFDRLHAEIRDSNKNSAIVEELLMEIRKDFEGRRFASEGIDAYACTLLFVAKCGKKVIIGNLGDGIILKQTKHGVALASRPDQGEFANVTEFVTSHDAASRFRLWTGECGKSDSILLACDGVSDSFHSKRTGTIAPAVATLFKWGKLNTGGKMKAILKKNLQMTFLPRTTDDVSMALLIAD